MARARSKPKETHLHEVHEDPLINPHFFARLKKYGVPEYPFQPLYDRIIMFQIDTVERETVVEGGRIITPDESKHRDRRMAPRGVLLAAGLGARDHLEAHDVMIGDICWFARHAINAYELPALGGRHKQIVFLRSSELVGSEDSLRRVADGTTRFERSKETGQWQVAGRARVDIEASADAM